MGILQQPLGINVTIYNPLVRSPYGSDIGVTPVPPDSGQFIITENGSFILTENLNYIITE